MMDIAALNVSQPYSNKTLTPFEELYGISSPVNGIPMTDEASRELVERKYLSDKIQRAELRNSNPTLKPFNKEDRHIQTKKDNELSNDWVEKINGSYGEPLTCGDRVYYIDHQASGSNRWRRGIVLQRKQDYVYSTGIHRSHGYDLYDIKNCTTVSRTRQDIRKYKHTKIEREILERANKHLADMRREFLKSDFQNPRMEKPVEFEIKDYDTAVKNSIYPQAEVRTPVPTPEAPSQEPEIKQEPVEEATTPISPEVTQPVSPKIPMALRKLQSNLDGKAWECTDTHRPRLRVRTTGIQEEDEYQDHWDNIVPAEKNEIPEEE